VNTATDHVKIPPGTLPLKQLNLYIILVAIHTKDGNSAIYMDESNTGRSIGQL
jgi:hypothetical protein